MCRSTIGIFLLFSLLICLANISQVESESYSVSWTSPNTYSWGVELNTTIGVGFIGYPSIVELNLSPEVAVANQTTNLMDGDRSDIFYLEESLQPLTYYTATLVYGEEDDHKSYIWIFVSEDSLLRSVSPKPGSSNVSDNVMYQSSFVMKFAKLPSIVELTFEPEVPIVDTKILIFSTQEFPPGGTDHYYFFPNEPLQPKTTYTASLIFGEENNTRSFTWNFTTGDQGIPNPPIEMPYAPHNYFPEPCSIDVPLNTTISISFARPPGNVELSMSPEAAVKESTFEAVNIYGGLYTFHLSELLEPSTTYNVTMLFSSGDATWGIAPGTRTWNFTTTTDSIPKERGETPESDPFSNLPSAIIGFITSRIGQLLLVITIAIVGAIVILVLVLNRKRKSLEVVK